VRRRGETIGALSLWSTRANAFVASDVAFLEAVAGQYGQALHRAEGYESEHRTSQALQRRLLSDVPVLHDRATIVTRYQPASSEVAVGGDWYDVVPLGQDRLAVVVGDVVGSGVEAAAVMGQLRSALKGIAFVSPEPVVVLDALDQLAAATAGAPAATVCYALVDLAAATVRFSRAGHPPPLLVSGGTDGDARFLFGHADLPLGLRQGGRREATADLAPGDVLLLYTDGLVERREEGLDVRLELLRTSAAKARRDTVDGLVDDVLEGCIGGVRLRDDLAVLALRDEPAGPERFRVIVPASARQLGPVRHALRDWLLERGVDEDHAGEVLLATSEAATNAVEHAYRDGAGGPELVGVMATLEGDEVVVDVRDTGRWKARPSDTTRGRGLAIARQLGDLEVRSGPSGTTVTFRSSVSAARTRAR
jgi:serine phosphatase RsbU (regulator of sigma subunit)/anti-sigma regulatory factor (Ser/Thr protein kinase)